MGIAYSYNNLQCLVRVFVDLGAKNTPKSGPFKTTKIAQTLPKQLENNFEIVQNATFSTAKMVKNDPLKSQK